LLYAFSYYRHAQINPASVGAQAAPAVQLREIKQEPEDGPDPSQAQDKRQQDKGQASKKGVSALKGFWETQSAAKP